MSTLRSAWYPQWRSVVVKLLYRDECAEGAEGVRELCFINAVMNSHLCDVIQKFKTKDAPLIPYIISNFFSMTMKILILPRWKSFSGRVFHSILSLLSSCGGLCRDELSIKDQSIQWGLPPGVKQDRCEHLSWTCANTQCQEVSEQFT